MPKPKIQVGDLYQDEYGNTVEIEKVTARRIHLFYHSDGFKLDYAIPLFRSSYEKIAVQKPVDSAPELVETPDDPIHTASERLDAALEKSFEATRAEIEAVSRELPELPTFTPHESPVEEITTPAPEPQRPATIADIARALGLKTQAGIHAFEVAVENVQLLDRKQQDYGPNNIAAFGELGVLVRANDKIERLKNLHKTGRLNDPQNESVTDSWLDLSNYGIIATLIRRGLWG